MNSAIKTVAGAVGLAAMAMSAQAADWSDTSMGYRTGSEYREPFNNKDISKNIVNFAHVSGDKYGGNFLNVDLLVSNKDDPSSPTSSDGAQEAYIVYRRDFDIGKISGKDMKFGPVRGVAATVGFDFNTKDDAGYNSKKRMLVAGPTFMMDVPGFLNISLLALWESNAPTNEYLGTSVARYSYDTHPMLGLSWGIPIGSSGFSFEGFANFIASKGKDEFGNNTAPETNIDAQVMYDASRIFSASKNTFKIGVEYQYWKNKFGNDSGSTDTSGGSFAKTPMVRAEYHF